MLLICRVRKGIHDGITILLKTSPGGRGFGHMQYPARFGQQPIEQTRTVSAQSLALGAGLGQLGRLRVDDAEGFGPARLATFRVARLRAGLPSTSRLSLELLGELLLQQHSTVAD
jgi:hypothetical protein